ncbi:MAG: nickel-dependent hydrogenase large subunit [Candidatus Brocadiia bacterium]
MGTNKNIVFSPFTRVEGDLRLGVEVEDGTVDSARASGTLFRNFENLLRGRDPMDAIVVLCRICGQCGAAHSRASAGSLADAFGVEPPKNGFLAATVIQAAEFILSHMAHFYFSFAPDLCGLPEQEDLEERFEPVRGSSFRQAVKVRRTLLGLMGLFAGKWPNTLAIQPGGVTRPLTEGELIRSKGILAEFQRGVEGSLLRGRLDDWLANTCFEDVERWLETDDHSESDLGLLIRRGMDNGLTEIGKGPARFLSTGCLELGRGESWLRAGYRDEDIRDLEATAITEDVAFSWFDSGGKHPSEQGTIPAPDKKKAYSWAKAPRYKGKSVEVGPLARMVIDGDPLALDLNEKFGPSVLTRSVMRIHEMLRLMKAMESWIEEIDPERPFCRSADVSGMGEGCALTGAPRGVLGHWLRVEKGRIRNYQVVTPTSWNLSPRDSNDHPGPLEEALVGTPVEDPDQATNVALVVRSYDPCLYCSVH